MPKPGSGWHRANRNSPAAKQRQKEYNSPEYKARRAADAKLVAAGLAHCWRCGKWLAPGKPWHEGHDDHNRAVIRGPECPACNLGAAARKGNAASNRKRARRKLRTVQRRSLLG